MGKIAVLVYAATKDDSRIMACAKGLVEGLQAGGALVDLINLKTADSFRPAMYEYLCFGYDAGGVFATKITPAFVKQLEQVSPLAGKRAMAFVLKKTFFSEKVLGRLMRVLESQGIFLRTSGVFASPEAARDFGRNLDTSRKQA